MKYFFLALSVVFIFASCSQTPTITPSRENLLRAGHWKLSGGTISFRIPNGKDTTVQYLTYVPDCYLDDYIVFDSLNYGKVYMGGNKCSAADPDYKQFTWRFTNNGNNMDLYDGFNNLFAVGDTMQPFAFDTLQTVPYLVLDTIHGILDTLPSYTRAVPVLDTVWKLHFGGFPLGLHNSGVASGQYDIYNATVTNFSSSSFTLHFSILGTYPDSTGYHTGYDVTNNIDWDPIQRPDTIHYVLTYSN